jgi:hypothetical protein
MRSSRCRSISAASAARDRASRARRSAERAAPAVLFLRAATSASGLSRCGGRRRGAADERRRAFEQRQHGQIAIAAGGALAFDDVVERGHDRSAAVDLPMSTVSSFSAARLSRIVPRRSEAFMRKILAGRGESPSGLFPRRENLRGANAAVGAGLPSVKWPTRPERGSNRVPGGPASFAIGCRRIRVSPFGNPSRRPSWGGTRHTCQSRTSP